jgi:hypothetical protein
MPEQWGDPRAAVVPGEMPTPERVPVLERPTLQQAPMLPVPAIELAPVAAPNPNRDAIDRVLDQLDNACPGDCI